MPPETESPGVLLVLIPVLFLLVFPLFWSGIVLLVGTLGGWRRLAAAYPATGAEATTTWRFRGGRMGFMNYKGVLDVGVSDAGLHLGVFLPFRVGHPPILVPWDQVEVGPDKSRWFSTAVPLSFPGAGGLTLELYGVDGEVLRKAKAGGG